LLIFKTDSGMFWRTDPTKNNNLDGNANWPRDGATLKGTEVEVSGKKWLLCTHVKQAGGDWVEAPVGAAMPFAYEQYYLE
jgi:hypothetical protein